MPHATYFVQECSTCGRRLQVRVEYLGRRVACQHCRGIFVAIDPASQRSGSHLDQSGILLQRANQLLESVGHSRSQPVS